MSCDKCTESGCRWRDFGLKMLELCKTLYSTDGRVRELHSPCGRVEKVNDELVECNSTISRVN